MSKTDLIDLIPFTIKRSEWLRGELFGSQPLCGSDAPSNRRGLRCCVGIWLRSLGIPDDYLRGRSVFEDVADDLNVEDADVTWLDEQLPYKDNDDPILSESRRERLIAKAFRRIGYQPVFED